MFARKVSVCLKPNTLRPFIDLMENELLPWLRAQRGFLDLVTLACPDAIEVQVISFWECEKSAEACSEGYPENVVKMLQELLDGISCGKTFEVVSSTLERLAARPQELEANVPAELPNSDHRSYETNA